MTQIEYCVWTVIPERDVSVLYPKNEYLENRANGTLIKNVNLIKEVLGLKDTEMLRFIDEPGFVILDDALVDPDKKVDRFEAILD